MLNAEKSIRPYLLADGDTLHLLFDVWVSGIYTAHHASYANGTWSESEPIGLGAKGNIAFDAEGGLHAVVYRDFDLFHFRRVDDGWVEGDPIPTPESVNPFGISMVSTAEGITLAVGAGTCGSLICHDITLFNWSMQGWSSEVLYTSRDLSSDEPGGALMLDGSIAWAWAEQVPYEPFISAIVFHSALDPEPLTVFEDAAGFASEPSVAMPLDGVPLLTWLAPGSHVMIDRYPFEQPTMIFESAWGPTLAVDAYGFTHVVAYAVDAAGVEQIWHTTNRMAP
jgi:hypothetical protein